MKRQLTLLTTMALAATVLAAGAAPASPSLDDLDGGLIVVLGCGEAGAPQVAAKLGESGNSVVHAIAGSPEELAAFREAIARGNVKGIVSAEQLGLQALPYRDYLVNTLVIMDIEKALAAGLTLSEARRCMAPSGRLVTCKGGRIDGVEAIPLPAEMDVWTHRYYRANGIPASQDQVFDLPLGYKWNAGLPMNFDNPKRAANRYSSTRAMVVDDVRCFTFSTAVYENLGQSWTSEYGTNQYLTCRDAFNGRLLWRKRIGGTYYGGLYIENLAPLVSTGRRLYLAGENGFMLKVDTRTGETLQELPTTYIPGVIAATNGIVVTATWKEGEVLGAIVRYDRRRMDWAIDKGAVEAYDDETGRLLWKNDLLGTSLLVAEGRVIIVNRNEKDDIEKGRRGQPGEPKRPVNRLIGMDLASGRILWKTDAAELNLADQTLNLEAAASGAVVVATGNRGHVTLVSAETGKLLEPEAAGAVQDTFFRYRNHICTPVFHVNEIRLNNRGGQIAKGDKTVNFGGARAACLLGTIPAYGAGFIAQNWCICSPGQIPGLLALGPIGAAPTAEDIERPAEPVVCGGRPAEADAESTDLHWTTFRGNASRSSSSPCEVSTNVVEVWTSRVTAELREGTVLRDWRSFLNSRLTAPVIAGKVAIVGDVDHNEVIAVGLRDGKVAWRFMTGGRMDTAPTLYKGICLVGDRTGHVSALNAANGELIYRLRVAPEEKRMLSYGKVESVWPVIGGVLVADGKAYASAGRSDGSDGGLVVRVFDPETGRPIAARAVSQAAGGAGPKRNDALILQAGCVRLMDRYLDPATVELCGEPAVDAAVVDAARAAKKERLGRELSEAEMSAVEKEATEAAKSRKITMGREGIYSWNWTRLGHRKFGILGYGGVNGDTICWNDHFCAAAAARDGRLTMKAANGQHKTVTLPKGSQGTSLVLCHNVVLQGGRLVDGGQKKGFIRAIEIDSGEVVWENTYDAELAFNGLAVDRGEIVASFDDGTITMLK